MPAYNDLFTAIEQYDKMNFKYLAVRHLLFRNVSCSHSRSTRK
jgi:hypothetical protein